VHAPKSSRFGVATAHELNDTTDSQNFEAMLRSQIDYSMDSTEIVNNKAEKSCSGIAEAREADETIRKVWHALCVCELPFAEATGRESRLMETGYYARTPRGRHPTSRPTTDADARKSHVSLAYASGVVNNALTNII
jgi:hypothetical protein